MPNPVGPTGGPASTAGPPGEALGEETRLRSEVSDPKTTRQRGDVHQQPAGTSRWKGSRFGDHRFMQAGGAIRPVCSTDSLSVR